MTDLDTTDHAFLGGMLTLREPRRGHRSGTDAVLLAAASRLAPGQHLVDVGAGAGAAALSALCRVADATATLVERDPDMAALARHNVSVNGLERRAEVVEADLFDRIACDRVLARRGDVVISNPPFYLRDTVRASDDSRRAAAHVLDGHGHADWIRRLLDLTSAKGRVVVIHRPDALPSILQAMERRAAMRFRSIHPSVEKAATRIIVEALPGRRSPFVVEAPVSLHVPGGALTAFADDLHRGQCWL